MNEWEKPEVWEKMGPTIAGLAVLIATLSKLKKRVRRKGKGKSTLEQVAKQIEELEKDLQKTIDLAAKGFDKYNRLITQLVEEGLRPFFDEHFKWRKSIMDFIQESAKCSDTSGKAITNLLSRVRALEVATLPAPAATTSALPAPVTPDRTRIRRAKNTKK